MWWTSSSAPSSRQATSRNHRPASCSDAVQRAVVRAALGAAARLVALALGALALLGGQQVEVGVDAAPDLAGGGVAVGLRVGEDGIPRPVGERAAQRPARVALGGGAQRGPVAERQRDGALHVAEGEPAAGAGGLRRHPVGPEPLRDLVGARRVEAHGLAAAGDRGQHVARAAGEQQQVGEGGRLLERLEHRLAAWSLSSSARSMTNTRRCASNGVRDAAETTAWSMSPTRIPALELGATQVRSGCTPSRARWAALAGSGEPSESSAAANARATSAFPLPAGPWKR